MEVLLATYHADEPQGTPHMHILVQFTGEGYKQGLNKQISISKALELDGFERSNNRGDYAINRWVEDVKDNIMTSKLEWIYGEQREILNDKRSHEDIRFFRKKAKEEAEALSKIKIEVEKKVENRTCDLKEIDEQIKYQEKRLDFYTRKQEEAKKEYNVKMDRLNSVVNEVCMLEMRQLDLDRNINDKTDSIKALQGEIDDVKDQRDKYKQQKDMADKELNDVLEQVNKLRSEYELMKSQPPKTRYIDVERIVEVPKEVEVPVEVKKRSWYIKKSMLIISLYIISWRILCGEYIISYYSMKIFTLHLILPG